ncbi:hypothetical protein BDFG_09331, partial [Blastomyces dermatitidis ATCC 26199]
VKAVSETIEKVVMKFLHNKIYVNYEILCKILTDNSVNLVEKVMRHLISQLQIRYYRITSYHLQINRKIKYLNKILSTMLTKYL